MPGQIEMFDGTSVKQRSVTFRPIERPLWTKNKAKLIERYLYYFVLVTKHGTYIDGFAGPQSPDNEDMWAAKLVIESRPRWLRTIILADINRKQVRRLEALKESQPPKLRKEPKREVIVISGDFNKHVDSALSHVKPRQAAFCLLDQRTFECSWQTVAKVARFKTQGNKVEIFYFLPVGWFARAASALKHQSEDLRLWWGRDDWGQLTNLRTRSLADVTCERFKTEFGYAFVHPWPIYKSAGGGRILYYMVHASDHELAPTLMRRAYSKALDEPETPDQLTFLKDVVT